VALRPEKFGALAYHYDTRRLAFLKSQILVDAVKGLESAPDATTVVDRLGLSPAKRQVVLRALAQLCELGIVSPR
jgi:putative mycofactocin binding protein MftB